MMMIFSQSLKKCWVLSFLVLFALSAQASLPKPDSISNEIQKDIRSRQSLNFQALLSKWESHHGSKAIDPLYAIAKDAKKYSDDQRYVAIMGIAKLSGAQALSKITPFLKDPSWMLRNAAIKMIAALGNDKEVQQIFPLISDPALVVRSQAIWAIEKRKPDGSLTSLLKVLHEKQNYHQGKALWVVPSALKALATLKPQKKIALELKSLLDKSEDPSLQKETIATLESIVGEKKGLALPLRDQVELWRTTLKKMASN